MSDESKHALEVSVVANAIGYTIQTAIEKRHGELIEITEEEREVYRLAAIRAIAHLDTIRGEFAMGYLDGVSNGS